MVNKRKIGLKWCGQVADILRHEKHVVDGPFNKTIFMKGRRFSAHVDIAGVYDLISFKDRIIYLHQVTAINMKSNRMKKMRKFGVKGILWCKCKNKEMEWFRRFIYDPQKGEYETSGILK